MGWGQDGQDRWLRAFLRLGFPILVDQLAVAVADLGGPA